MKATAPITPAIANKGFRLMVLRSSLAAHRFIFGGRSTAPQSLTGHSPNRYGSVAKELAVYDTIIELFAESANKKQVREKLPRRKGKRRKQSIFKKEVLNCNQSANR